MRFLLEYSSFGNIELLDDCKYEVLEYLQYYIETLVDEDYPKIVSSNLQINRESSFKEDENLLLYNNGIPKHYHVDNVGIITISPTQHFYRLKDDAFYILANISDISKGLKLINKDLEVVKLGNSFLISNSIIFRLYELNVTFLNLLDEFIDEFEYSFESNVSNVEIELDKSSYNYLQIKISGLIKSVNSYHVYHIWLRYPGRIYPEDVDNKLVYEIEFGDSEIENFLKEKGDFTKIEFGFDSGIEKIEEMINLIVMRFFSNEDIIDLFKKLDSMKKIGPGSIIIDFDTETYERGNPFEIIIHYKDYERQAFLLLDENEMKRTGHIKIIDEDDKMWGNTTIQNIEEDLFLYISENL
jgi:hypothetical protein